jgi:hypothetical protein
MAWSARPPVIRCWASSTFRPPASTIPSSAPWRTTRFSVAREVTSSLAARGRIACGATGKAIGATGQ